MKSLAHQKTDRTVAKAAVDSAMDEFKRSLIEGGLPKCSTAEMLEKWCLLQTHIKADFVEEAAMKQNGTTLDCFFGGTAAPCLDRTSVDSGDRSDATKSVDGSNSEGGPTSEAPSTPNPEAVVEVALGQEGTSGDGLPESAGGAATPEAEGDMQPATSALLAILGGLLGTGPEALLAALQGPSRLQPVGTGAVDASGTTVLSGFRAAMEPPIAPGAFAYGAAGFAPAAPGGGQAPYPQPGNGGADANRRLLKRKADGSAMTSTDVLRAAASNPPAPRQLYTDQSQIRYLAGGGVQITTVTRSAMINVWPPSGKVHLSGRAPEQALPLIETWTVPSTEPVRRRRRGGQVPAVGNDEVPTPMQLLGDAV